MKRRDDWAVVAGALHAAREVGTLSVCTCGAPGWGDAKCGHCRLEEAEVSLARLAVACMLQACMLDERMADGRWQMADGGWRMADGGWFIGYRLLAIGYVVGASRWLAVHQPPPNCARRQSSESWNICCVVALSAAVEK